MARGVPERHPPWRETVTYGEPISAKISDASSLGEPRPGPVTANEAEIMGISRNMVKTQRDSEIDDDKGEPEQCRLLVRVRAVYLLRRAAHGESIAAAVVAARDVSVMCEGRRIATHERT